MTLNFVPTPVKPLTEAEYYALGARASTPWRSLVLGLGALVLLGALLSVDAPNEGALADGQAGLGAEVARP